MTWHILTGEYPPQPGGVSAYTRSVARGLVAAGDQVVVWAPPAGAPDAPEPGVVIERLPDRFGRRSLRRLDAELERGAGVHRLLVQYVPHAFGWKAANVPFCRWLASRRRDGVWVMFHEVAFPFDPLQSPSRNALAIVNRLMARTVASAAERVFVSIPGWRAMIDAYVDRHTPAEWLPVPSGIAVATDAGAVAAVRAGLGANGSIVGHLGTHSTAIRRLLAIAVPPMLQRTDCRVVLIGPGGEEARQALVAGEPRFAARINAVGALPDAAVSHHIAACDVMLQPYPDGISTRRTSAMAALAHGVALVTTTGWLTEPLWAESEAAALAPVDDPVALADRATELLESPDARVRLADRGRALYDATFDVRHTIAALRRPIAPARAVGAGA